jgi:hypothetical protein
MSLLNSLTDAKCQKTEDRIALLMGHERGTTESFKTYSKNSASSLELSGYVEKINYDFLLSN